MVLFAKIIGSPVLPDCTESSLRICKSLVTLDFATRCHFGQMSENGFKNDLRLPGQNEIYMCCEELYKFAQRKQ